MRSLTNTFVAIFLAAVCVTGVYLLSDIDFAVCEKNFDSDTATYSWICSRVSPELYQATYNRIPNVVKCSANHIRTWKCNALPTGETPGLQDLP